MVGEFLINGMNAISGIDHKEDHLGRLDCDIGFSTNLISKSIIEKRAYSAGVRQLKGDLCLLTFCSDSVARHARLIVNDRNAAAGEPIE